MYTYTSVECRVSANTRVSKVTQQACEARRKSNSSRLGGQFGFKLLVSDMGQFIFDIFKYSTFWKKVSWWQYHQEIITSKAKSVTTLKLFCKVLVTTSIKMGSVDWEAVLRIQVYWGTVLGKHHSLGIQMCLGLTDSTDHQASNYIHCQPSDWKQRYMSPVEEAVLCV